jgi:hypothetical protein
VTCFKNKLLKKQSLVIKIFISAPSPICLQILANPSHHFIDSALYKDVILVAWDPAPYSANLNLVSVFLHALDHWSDSVSV